MQVMLEIYKQAGQWTAINTPIGTYMDNLRRQQVQNKKYIDKIEARVKEMVALGVDPEIAKAMGNQVIAKLRKDTKLVETVRTKEQRQVVKIVEVEW
jgi:hypothetical protein